MMVANGDSLSSKHVTLTSRRNKHDAIVDAKSQLAIVIHERSDSQISKCKEGSALTDITTVEVGVGDGHHGNGVAGVNFSNLTTSIGGKAVGLIK
jgi:hypothetical protein